MTDLSMSQFANKATYLAVKHALEEFKILERTPEFADNIYLVTEGYRYDDPNYKISVFLSYEGKVKAIAS